MTATQAAGQAATQADIGAAKRAMRRDALARRRALGQAAGPAAAAALAANALAGLDPEAGTAVSAYWPMRDEIDPRPLLRDLVARGCVACLPVVVGRDRPLVFRRWSPGVELIPGGYGVLAPGPQADEIRPAILLLPLLAFDAGGFRLGYGGGFYDRTLAALRGAALRGAELGASGPVRAAGLAYAGQEVAAVPHDSGDERLDWIVTEREARKIAA